MLYAHVEDGQITYGPDVLPRNWRNVSGINKASAEDIKGLGWLPATKTEPTFDPTTHKKGDRVDTITANDVNVTWEVVAKSADELAEGVKSAAQAEIRRLESLETPRRISEALLGTNIGNSKSGRDWLIANREAIAIERAKL